MNSSVKVAPVERLPTPLLAVAVGTLNGKVPTSLLGLDEALDGALGRAIAQGDLTGARDSVQTFYGVRGPKRVLVIGMGKLGEITRGAGPPAAAVAGQRGTGFGGGSLTV